MRKHFQTMCYLVWDVHYKTIRTVHQLLLVLARCGIHPALATIYNIGTWRNAELNFLSLYLDAGFPETPKFHMMQHVYQQFEHDCAPRFSYCFAEESKNFRMAQQAQQCLNDEGLPERVMLMHETWAAAGCPSIGKIRKRQLRNTNTILRLHHVLSSL